MPEKKAENGPKSARETCFSPEDFRKFTPEKAKILPEKKRKNCAREDHKCAREKIVLFFCTGIFCIKYPL